MYAAFEKASTSCAAGVTCEPSVQALEQTLLQLPHGPPQSTSVSPGSWTPFSQAGTQHARGAVPARPNRDPFARPHTSPAVHSASLAHRPPLPMRVAPTPMLYRLLSFAPTTMAPRASRAGEDCTLPSVGYFQIC